MDENVSKFSELITRFLNNDLDERGKQELATYIEGDEDNRKLFEKLINEDLLFTAVNESSTVEAKVYDKLKKNIPELNDIGTIGNVVPMHRFSWRTMIAAAAVVFVLAAGAYVWLRPANNTQITKVERTESKIKDILPGKQGATLTLADGSVISVDSFSNGQLVQQGRTTVYNKDGKLVYLPKGDKTNEVLYNVLTTARGQMYPVVLSDNSRVWLNSASSIKFPVSFSSAERRVEITGEAYFEIAHDASKPFIVAFNGAEVQVLGTKFNVNAYKDEAVAKTTLLEGKVKISSANSTAVLKPGQQAQSTEEKLKVTEDVDTDAAIAWKNGIIAFSKSDIKEILRQISRWYDVDVEYKGEIKVQEIRGIVPRNIPLPDVLTALQMSSGLKFTIEGNKVTVHSR